MTMLDAPIATTRLNALLAVLALAAFTALVAGAAGHALGYDSAKAKGDAALARLQRDHATAVASAAETARKRLADEVDRANHLASQLAAEKTTHAQEKQTLLRRIANVTTVYVPAPGLAAVPLPRAVFTVGFVREYNAALGLPAAVTGASSAGAGAASDAGSALDAGLRDSGLSQADILAHIADYGERCRNLESQVNRLLDKLQGDHSE